MQDATLNPQTAKPVLQAVHAGSTMKNELPALPASGTKRLWAIARRILNARPWVTVARNLGWPLSDRMYLSFGHLLYFGRWPDYDNPRTFNEHIHAYMLRCRDPILHIAADKAVARDFIARTVGEQYLCPCIGVWQDVSEVPLESFDAPVVIKATVGSGMVLFVDPRENIDYAQVRAKLCKWLDYDYSRFHREWAYQDQPHRLIVEPMLTDERGNVPADYKAYVIGGRIRFIQVDRNRFGNHTRNLYSRDWDMINARLTLKQHTPDARPARLNELVSVAERLALNFEFLRVDFYVSDDWLYVGELTNYPGAGFERFIPASYSEKLGKYWSNPSS
jgi:hypothetical protein